MEFPMVFEFCLFETIRVFMRINLLSMKDLRRLLRFISNSWISEEIFYVLFVQVRIVLFNEVPVTAVTLVIKNIPHTMKYDG